MAFNLFMDTARGTVQVRPNKTPLQSSIQERIAANANSGTITYLQARRRASISEMLAPQETAMASAGAVPQVPQLRTVPPMLGLAPSPAGPQRLPARYGAAGTIYQAEETDPCADRGSSEYYKKKATFAERSSEMLKSTSPRPWHQAEHASSRSWPSVPCTPYSSHGYTPALLLPASVPTFADSTASCPASRSRYLQQQYGGEGVGNAGRYSPLNSTSNSEGHKAATMAMSHVDPSDGDHELFKQGQQEQPWKNLTASIAADDMDILFNAGLANDLDFSSQELIALYNGLENDSIICCHDGSGRDDDGVANEQHPIEKQQSARQARGEGPGEVITEEFKSEDWLNEDNWFPPTPPRNEQCDPTSTNATDAATATAAAAAVVVLTTSHTDQQAALPVLHTLSSYTPPRHTPPSYTPPCHTLHTSRCRSPLCPSPAWDEHYLDSTNVMRSRHQCAHRNEPGAEFVFTDLRHAPPPSPPFELPMCLPALPGEAHRSGTDGNHVDHSVNVPHERPADSSINGRPVNIEIEP